MHLIQLCFADDLRSLDVKATQNCLYDEEEGKSSGPVLQSSYLIPTCVESLSNKAIDTMKKIMGKLKQTYDPDVYPNPGQCPVGECGKELSDSPSMQN